MGEIAKELLSGKTLCVMPEKQLRKLKVDTTVERVQLNISDISVEVACYRSSPHKKLYILPEEYEKIPEEIRKMLNIKDIRWTSARHKNVETYDQLLQSRVSILTSKEYAKYPGRYKPFSIVRKSGIAETEIKLLQTANGKICILLDDYILLPADIQNSLHICSSLPYQDALFQNALLRKAPANINTAKLSSMESPDHKIETHSQDRVAESDQKRLGCKTRIYISDDSIRPYCKKIGLKVHKQEICIHGCYASNGRDILITAESYYREIPAQMLTALDIRGLDKLKKYTKSAGGDTSILSNRNDIYIYNDFLVTIHRQVKKKVTVSIPGNGSQTLKLNGFSKKGDDSVFYLTPYDFYVQIPPALRNFICLDSHSKGKLKRYRNRAANLKTVCILQDSAVTSRTVLPGLFFYESLELKGYTSKSNSTDFFMFPADFSKQVPPEMRKVIPWSDPLGLVSQYENSEIEENGNQQTSKEMLPVETEHIAPLEENTYFPVSLARKYKSLIDDPSDFKSTLSTEKCELFSALSSWLQFKQIFAFDDSLASELLASEETADTIVGEALLRCPYHSAYIIARDPVGSSLEFFVVLQNSKLHFCLVISEDKQENYDLLIDTHQQVRESLNKITDADDLKRVRKMLQLYAYLCSENREILTFRKEKNGVEGDVSIPKGKPNTHLDIPKRDVDVYTVTQRQSPSNKTPRKVQGEVTGRTHRPHMRRGHWHHVWMGPRKDNEMRHLDLRWYSEIQVNPTEDSMPAKVTQVRSRPS